MSRLPVLEELEAQYMKKDIPTFHVGDTVRVLTRIAEGEKERQQAFTGTVVAKRGVGLSETFTLYRNAYGSSMDRVFLVHSPRIAEIQVIRSGKVRRAKLTYLQGKAGKKAKVQELYNAGGASAVREEMAPSVDQ